MTRFDFDVIGDTPALKSRPPESGAVSRAAPTAAPVPDKPQAKSAEGPQMARRRDNAA